MKQNVLISVATVLITTLAVHSQAFAQAAVARQVVEEAAEQLFKQSARSGLEQLAAMGGKAAVRDILEQSAREGGEQLVRKVTQYGVEDGPIALRVISRSPARMVDALDGLAPALRSGAMSAVDRNPEILTNLIGKYGKGALKVATEHPGVGEKLVGTLGSDGIRLGEKLGTDEAILAARHVYEIAALAPAERSGVVNAMLRSPAKVLEFLESHPATLRTAAGVAIVCAIKNDILGDAGSSKVLADGQVVTTPPHPGLIERLLPSTLHALHFPLGAIGAACAAGIACWMSLHLFAKWKSDRMKLALQRAKLATTGGN